jgi:hypothetical protein
VKECLHRYGETPHVRDATRIEIFMASNPFPQVGIRGVERELAGVGNSDAFTVTAIAARVFRTVQEAKLHEKIGASNHMRMNRMCIATFLFHPLHESLLFAEYNESYVLRCCASRSIYTLVLRNLKVWPCIKFMTLPQLAAVDSRQSSRMTEHEEEVQEKVFSTATTAVMTMEELKKMRRSKRQKAKRGGGDPAQVDTDGRFVELMSNNEDELLKYVAKVNRVYQEKLKKPAPFMTFVFCGMQSAGKSTVMERFMTAVLNIVQEGTGTRCPLDTTCIHDDSLEDPTCELWGEELAKNGKDLTVDEVFKRVTEHNRKLDEEDRFSTEPLHLVYKANNVQNMRFVDTPGIISNQSTGKDNREDIKKILRSEMQKPNTKLCVLLEPKEYATNPIVEFCDSSLGGREKWIRSATFLMTKFDKQLNDSRTGSKANNFFKEFHENKFFPHLVITPTLAKEDLPPQKLYEARQKLLTTADEDEKAQFQGWRDA